MANEWWADYSNGTLPAAVLKQHGYAGVIRYVTTPELMNPRGMLQKHATRAEFDEHRRAGLKQLLVYQGDTRDADSGYAGGVRNAKRALAGAEYLGYRGLIFFTNDRTTLPSATAWRDYLDGAASVLGKARVGAYGFSNAMDAAIGHAAAFWQAGRRSDVRKHVHFWQDNNHQPVVKHGARTVTTDRNLVLKPIAGGGGSAPTGKDNDVELTDKFDEKTLTQKPGTVGHTLLNIRQNAAGTRAELAGLMAAVNKLADAVAKNSGVSPAELKKAVTDAIKEGVVKVDVSIGGQA